MEHRRDIMRTSIAIALACVLAWTALPVAADDSPEPPADVTWTSTVGVTAQAVASPKGPQIRVTGTRIRGDGTITFKEGAPRRFTIRIPHIQNRFSQITLSGGGYTMQGQMFTPGGKAVSGWDKGGKSVSPDRAPVTLTIEHHKDGHIDLHVACAKDVDLGKEVRLSWTRVYTKRFKN
jgi:hypothetical protein